MPRVDNLISKAKENSGFNEVGAAYDGEKKLIYSSDAAEVHEIENKELPIYSTKNAGKDKLASSLLDPAVQQVQVSNGKPALVTHSELGLLEGDFTVSPTSAAKTVKALELPVVFTSTKGDAGLVMSIEKLREGISVIDMVNNGSLTPDATAFLWTCLTGKIKPCNLLIVGNGASRLEALNAFAVLLPLGQRVAVTTGSAHSPHWTEMETPFKESVAKASEMKFDWVVGEIEPKNAKLLFNLHGKLRGLLAMSASTCTDAIAAIRETGGKAAVNSIDIVIAVHEADKQLRVTEVSEVINGVAKPLYLFENGALAQVKLDSDVVKHAIYLGHSQRAIEAELAQKTEQVKNWVKTGKRSNKEIRRTLIEKRLTR